MTFNEAREALYQRWVDEWGATTSFTFPGEDFTPPEADPWARVSVLHTRGAQETLGPVGSRRFERGGSVIVQLYALDNQGVKALDNLAESAKAVFEGLTLGDIRLQGSVFRETGSDGKWFQVVVETPFDYEQRR